MPIEHDTYFMPTPDILVMTKNAFASIENQIESAVVTQNKDIVYLSFSCHQKVETYSTIIRQGNHVSERESCASCTQRLRQIVGSCNSNYTAYGKQQHNDFTYLSDLLADLGYKEDVQIYTYLLAAQQHELSEENNLKDMDYREYVSLITFFESLNALIERFQRRNLAFKRWVHRT